MSPVKPPGEAEPGKPLYTIEHTKEQFISKKYPLDVGLRHQIQDGCAHVKCQGGHKTVVLCGKHHFCVLPAILPSCIYELGIIRAKRQRFNCFSILEFSFERY